MPQLGTWLILLCVYYEIDTESGHIHGEELVLLLVLLNMFRFCQ